MGNCEQYTQMSYSDFYDIAEYGNANWKGKFTPKEVAENAYRYYADFLWSVENKTVSETIKALCKNLAEDAREMYKNTIGGIQYMSQYHIYQTDADYKFMGWNSVRDRFTLDDYTKVYSGELLDSVTYGSKTIPCNENDMEVLESLFQTFNVDIPKCYHARSLSVGDVVMISRKEGSRYYYCDNVGWRLVLKN